MQLGQGQCAQHKIWSAYTTTSLQPGKTLVRPQPPQQVLGMRLSWHTLMTVLAVRSPQSVVDQVRPNQLLHQYILVKFLQGRG